MNNSSTDEILDQEAIQKCEENLDFLSGLHMQVFNKQIASVHGLETAIVFEVINRFKTINECSKETEDSPVYIEDIIEKCPYLTDRQIKRAVKKLKKLKVIGREVIE